MCPQLKGLGTQLAHALRGSLRTPDTRAPPRALMLLEAALSEPALGKVESKVNHICCCALVIRASVGTSPSSIRRPGSPRIWVNFSIVPPRWLGFPPNCLTLYPGIVGNSKAVYFCCLTFLCPRSAKLLSGQNFPPPPFLMRAAPVPALSMANLGPASRTTAAHRPPHRVPAPATCPSSLLLPFSNPPPPRPPDGGRPAFDLRAMHVRTLRPKALVSVSYG